jgi:hypothetical protein
MEKAYLVYKSWGICDDSSVVGVFLDEKIADEYVEEHGKNRIIEMKRYEKCYECKEKDNEMFKFKLKDLCENAVIKEDRHGLYCENDMSDFYSISSDDYWKVETDILG